MKGISFNILKRLRLPIVWLAQIWVYLQFVRHHRHGRPLSLGMRSVLQPWFQAGTLEKVRVRRVESIQGPGFVRWLRWLGLPVNMEFHNAAGITFGDAVLVTGKRAPTEEASLLFHELVHVVQYAELGMAGFISQYIRGWLDNGCDYYAIPLERQAYELEETFRRHPTLGMSVEEVVQESQATAAIV